MFFTGTHRLTVDSKYRLSIPLAVRNQMNAQTEGKDFYILPGRRKGTLALYPARYFEESLRRSPLPEVVSDEASDYQVFEYANCERLEPDAQGRVLVPKHLLERSGVGVGEVTLVGVHDRLELWSRAAFESFQDRIWPEYPQLRARAVQEVLPLTPPANHPGASA